MKKLCLLALGLSVGMSAYANNIYLGKYEGYEYYFYPQKTKQVATAKYEVTMERFVAKDVKKDGIAKGGYTIYKRYIDCGKKQVATISYKNYTKSGVLLGEDKMNHLKYYDIFPRSWGSALYDEICH